jgi:hypothetical protein
MTTHVVILPGVFGSTLVDISRGEDLLWLDPLDLLLDDALERLCVGHASAQITAERPVPMVYELLADDAAELGEVVLFAYDWRLSIRRAAHALLARLDRLAADTPGAQVVIVAHSLGALVARHAAQLVDLSSLVTQLIALGPPFSGSHAATEALAGAHPWFSAFGGRAHEVQQMIGTTTGLYELLPWASHAPALYAPDWWPAELGISAARLRDAHALHQELARPSSIDAVTDVVFAADRSTIAEVAWVDDELVTTRTGPGDGTVLAASTTPFSVRSSWQAEGDHTLLPLLPGVRGAALALARSRGCEAHALPAALAHACAVEPRLPRWATRDAHGHAPRVHHPMLSLLAGF